jgi:hypothetical protein
MFMTNVISVSREENHAWREGLGMSLADGGCGSCYDEVWVGTRSFSVCVRYGVGYFCLASGSLLRYIYGYSNTLTNSHIISRHSTISKYRESIAKFMFVTFLITISPFSTTAFSQTAFRVTHKLHPITP